MFGERFQQVDWDVGQWRAARGEEGRRGEGEEERRGEGGEERRRGGAEAASEFRTTESSGVQSAPGTAPTCISEPLKPETW